MRPEGPRWREKEGPTLHNPVAHKAPLPDHLLCAALMTAGRAHATSLCLLRHQPRRHLQRLHIEQGEAGRLELHEEHRIVITDACTPFMRGWETRTCSSLFLTTSIQMDRQSTNVTEGCRSRGVGTNAQGLQFRCSRCTVWAGVSVAMYGKRRLHGLSWHMIGIGKESAGARKVF